MPSAPAAPAAPDGVTAALPAEGGPHRSKGEGSRRRRLTPTQRGRAVQGAGWLVGIVLLGALALLTDWERVSDKFLDAELARELFPDVVTVGARNTVLYTVFSFAGGLVLGMVSALARRSPVALLRAYARIYVELFRGLPAVLTIFLVGFAVPIGLGVKVPKVSFDVPFSTGQVELSGAGILALALVAGAYMSETIRAGLQAVPRGQAEAARSLGMSSAQTTTWVVVPQAFRIVIPPLANELILLLKDTALLAVLGTTPISRELTKFGRDSVGSNLNMTPLVVVGALYVLITIPLTQIVARLERRQQRAR